MRPSRANELWYQAQLRAIARAAGASAVKRVLPVLKLLTERRVVGDALRSADEADALPAQVYSALDAVAGDLGGIEGVARRLAAEAVRRNLSAVDERLTASIVASVGVDVSGALTEDGDVRDALAAATEANVALITSLPEEYLAKLQKNVETSWSQGATLRDLEDTLQHTLDVTVSRAKLIGRDQTSKMNGAFNRVRQTSLGIDSYEWQTAGDERVRETHAENDGQTFAWADPPAETGHPGDDINCRCVALPKFDLDEQDEETEEDDE